VCCSYDGGGGVVVRNIIALRLIIIIKFYIRSYMTRRSIVGVTGRGYIIVQKAASAAPGERTTTTAMMIKIIKKNVCVKGACWDESDYIIYIPVYV